MEGNEVLDSLLQGYPHQYQLQEFEYDDESGGYTLKFFADSNDSTAGPIEVMDVLKENSGQQFVFKMHKPFAFSSNHRYDCHLSTRSRDSAEGKKTGCTSSITFTYYDRQKAKSPRGLQASKSPGSAGAAARKAPFDCLVILRSRHNHVMESIDALKKLAPAKHHRESFLW